MNTNTCSFSRQVVVGDQAGVLQVFSIKKEDTHVHFKTLPTDKITTVRLGGVGNICKYSQHKRQKETKLCIFPKPHRCRTECRQNIHRNGE